MKLSIRFIIIALLIAVGIVPAFAQSESVVLLPIFGQTYINGQHAEDVNLDPYVATVVAGGTIDASTIDPDCVGYVTERPTYGIRNYGTEQAGFRVFTASDFDPTLLIRTPSGEILCNDDFSQILFDSIVNVNTAAAGEYQVWVGSYEPEVQFPVLLAVTQSDIDPTTLDLSAFLSRSPTRTFAPTIPLDELDLENAGETVTSGGVNQQVSIEDAGGEVPLFLLITGNDDCRGFAAATPNVAYELSGSVPAVRFYFEAMTDAVMMIITPSGEVLCNAGDDAALNPNPTIEVTQPEEGRYLIFVGTYLADATISGTLMISEAVN